MATTLTAPAPKPPRRQIGSGFRFWTTAEAKPTLCAGCGHNAISERIVDALL